MALYFVLVHRNRMGASRTEREPYLISYFPVASPMFHAAMPSMRRPKEARLPPSSMFAYVMARGSSWMNFRTDTSEYLTFLSSSLEMSAMAFLFDEGY